MITMLVSEYDYMYNYDKTIIIYFFFICNRNEECPKRKFESEYIYSL